MRELVREIAAENGDPDDRDKPRRLPIVTWWAGLALTLVGGLWVLDRNQNTQIDRRRPSTSRARDAASAVRQAVGHRRKPRVAAPVDSALSNGPRQFCIESEARPERVRPERGRLGRIVAAGRCWKGPIPLGTTFTAIATPQSDGTLANTGSCLLIAEEISLYGRLVDELDEGLTARIVLVGEADRPLHPMDVLTDSG